MSTSRGPALTAALVVLLAVGRASADVPPPDRCSVAGQACNTAQTTAGYNGAGTCEVSTCAHSGPLPDGAIGTSQSPCNVCVATGASSSGGGGDASTSGGGSPSSGGCAAVGASPGFAPFALVAAGAAIVALSRRRRARR
jgi:hypothetical protein